MNTMKIAAFIAKHPNYEERIEIAHGWAYALAHTHRKKGFDPKAFVEACGVKYQKPPLEEA